MNQDNNNNDNKNLKTTNVLFQETYENVLDEENSPNEEFPSQTHEEVLSLFEFSNPKLLVLENAKQLFRQFKMYYHKKDKNTRSSLLAETRRELLLLIKQITFANAVNLYARPKKRRSYQENAFEILAVQAVAFAIYLEENALSPHEFSVLATIHQKTVNSLKGWIISDHDRYLKYITKK
jgi:hypothetical protein